MATVYDKSSLFLAPSGVSNGTVFVQKPVPIYGSEQVTNGDFSQEGAELVTNGDFATDSDWNKTNSVISGGVATITSTGYAFAAIVQTNVLTVGKTYKATIDVKSVTGGLVVGGTSDTITSSGIISVYFTASQTYLEIKRDGVYATTIAEIDNVSVKEVGQDWTIGTNWSLGDSKAIAGGSGGTISQSGGTSSGKTYVLTYTVSDYAFGGVRARVGDTYGTTSQANGTYQETIDSQSSGGLEFYNISNTSLSITNISLKEVLSPDGDFTFTRGSNLSATRVNEAQLIEKGRENLVLQSNNFSDSDWTKTGLSLVSGGQSGYDGSNDAYLITSNASTANHYLRQSGATQSGVQTYSIYAKGNGYDVQLRATGIGSTTNWVSFNLVSGSVGTSGAGIIESKMTSLGNGWYRCSATFNDSGSPFIGIYMVEDADTAGSGPSFTGDGVSGVFLQDAQVEQSLVATPYIETGASTAQAGLLENTPRLDYSGGATCPSLLLEPSRTNIVGESEYYNGVYWGLTSASVTNNATTSPEGLQNASKLIPANGTGGNRSVSRNYASITGVHTFSVFAKAGEYGYISLRLRNSPSAFAMFDLTNGLVHAANTTQQMVSGSPKIEDYGNGWYRCSIVLDPSGSATPGQLYPSYSAGITGDEVNAFNGDGVSGIYIWGAQFEEGSYATSYIPTYGTSQTRAVDNTATLDLSPFGLNGEDVTHFIEFKNNQAVVRDNGGTTLRFSSDNINFGSLRVYRSASSLARRLTVVFQDTNGNFSNPGSYEITGLNPKVAIKRVWATGEIKVFADGNKVIDAASTLFNSWNIVDMEGTGSTVEVKQLVSFPEALSDLDCEILTGATTYETFDEMALALNYTVYE